MHLSYLNLPGVTAGSAVGAVVGIVLEAKRVGKDPSDYGPRALVSQFLGFWFGYLFFVLSWVQRGTPQQWIFFGLSMVTFYSGWGLSVHFANKPEMSESLDQKPTGFRSHLTSLRLR
jgi:hypothetical protein